MKPTIQCLIAVQVFAFSCLAEQKTEDLPITEIARKQLENGEAVVLPRRPDEKGETDKRFVTMAKLITGSRVGIWTVINDKEDAENFIDGVLSSKVTERDEDSLVVEQETRVGGPKGSYRYKLRHRLTGMERADFTFIEGDIENIEGTWWIFDWPDAEKHLVVYTLHVDPGKFAPQFIVKSGMKKSIPGTFRSIEKEVERRRQKAGTE